MRKNVANQKLAAQLIAKADGTNVTSGTTTVYVTIDAGTQGSIGTATHEGNGCWSIDSGSASNTNGDHLAITWVNTSAITVTQSVYTYDSIVSEVWTYDTRTLTDGSIRVASPYQVGRLTILRGGSYYNADSNAIAITKGDEFTWPSDLFSASGPAWVVTLYAEPTASTLADYSSAAALASGAGVAGTVTSATACYFDLSKTQTAALTVGKGGGAYAYRVIATRASSPAKEWLLESGMIDMVDDMATA